MRKRVLRLWAIAVLIVLAPASLTAQDRQITGQVTRSGTEQPVQSAAVSAAGADPVLTDGDGRFTITAPAGEVTLAVSAFGYAEEEIVVAAGESTVDIALRYDAFQLGELVVTGQATSVARRNATTSVEYVSGEEIGRVSSPTILNAMTGRVAGVNLQTNSGAPGGGIQMQIRGNTTILGDFDPLFVVDGVPYSNARIASGRGMANNAFSPSTESDAVNRIADLDPADIQDIQVLKGASASSIYGSKAANGVVIITTKRGGVGAPRINITQRFGVFTPLRLLETRRWTRDEAVDVFEEDAMPFFEGNANPYFDQYDQVFGNRELSYETIMNVSGGTEDTQYYISGGWKHDGGIEWNTGASRQGLRANLDQALGSRFNVSISTAYSRNENDRGWDNNCNNNGCHGYAIAYTPSFVNFEARNADGSYFDPSVVGVTSNPLQLTELGVNHEETNRFTGGLSLNWSAIESERHNLRLVGAGGVDAFDQNNDVWTPNELYFEQVASLQGESIESGGRSLQYNWNVNGIHTWTPGSWSATTSAGLQYEDRRLNTFGLRTQGLLPGQRNVDQGADFTPSENLEQERTFAFYADETLRLFDDRLQLVGGVRAERSSVNGDQDKFYAFPKVSGSYRFLDLLGPGSEVKLRAAYGETGNQPRFGDKFTTLGTPQLGGQLGYTVSDTAGFTDIEPERQKEIEAGIDGEVLNGRLTWELTGFNTRSTNLLLQRVPAPSTGFSTQLFNGGELRNSGVEIALGVTPLLSRSAQWTVRGTFTRHTNEVVDLAGLPSFFPPQSGFGSLGQTRIEEGKPITQIVGFDLLCSRDNSCGGANPDTMLTDSLVQLGNSTPDFRVGFVNDITYKALNLSIVLDWQQGGDVVNLTQFLHDDGQTTEDWGTPEWEERMLHFRNGSISPYIEDATFLKVREVALGVNLPRDFAQSLGMGFESVRLGLTARNLFMWTKYSGLDPEVANFGAAAIRNNLDISPYPPSRSIFFNVSVGF